MSTTYEEFINNILETRGRFACGDEYHERHHILPRCLGGTNNEENLIDLFAREHFIAHRLLAIENPENIKLIYAWGCMAFVKRNDTDRYEVSPDEYEDARIALSISLRGKCFGGSIQGVPKSEEHKRKISEGLKGRKWSETQKINFSKARKGIKIKPHSTETRQKQSLAQMGEKNHRYGKHHTEEHKKILSEMNKGEKNKFYGKHHTNEIKKVLSQLHNRPIYCIETKQIYDSSLIAQEKTGISNSSIGKCCSNKQSTAGGYHWRYLYDQTRKDGTVIPGAITLGLITEGEALKMLEEQKDKMEE